MRQETMQSIAVVANKGQKYDEACKKFFRNRERNEKYMALYINRIACCHCDYRYSCGNASSGIGKSKGNGKKYAVYEYAKTVFHV